MSDGSRGHDLLNPSISPTVAERVDHACAEFEEAWRSGRRPQIEASLSDVVEPQRTAQLQELLLLDIDYRTQAGEKPGVADYHDRFPHDEPAIREAFLTLRCYTGEPQHFASGDTVGRYVVGRQIGRGAVGAVYLATDEELGRKVVIKVPRHDRGSSPRLVRQMIHEARTVAGLRHPGIVPVHDAGTQDGTFFVVLQFIDGVTLQESLQETTTTPRDACRILASVAEAVHYAHQQKIVHRDLKPSNILLDDEQTPFVTDFGLAVDPQRTNNWEFAGTLPYMAPEQIDSARDIDGRVDIWALGVILQERTSVPRSVASLKAVLSSSIARYGITRVWKCCSLRTVTVICLPLRVTSCDDFQQFPALRVP